MIKKSKAIEIIKGTKVTMQEDYTGSLTTNRPKILLNPSISILTTYPSKHLGSGLRQFQRRFWSSESGQNLEICD
jgi:hypothetical protein